MTIDSLTLWFIVGPIQCASQTLVHSTCETHPDGQDKAFIKLRGSALQSMLYCPNPWTNYGQLISI